MRTHCDSMLFLLVLLPSSPLAASSRSEADLSEVEADGPCLGCTKYAEAPDYSDNWLKEVGPQKTLDLLNIREDETDGELTDWEKMAALKVQWDLAAHALFNLAQGQACMDLCAVCMPPAQDMRSEETAKLQTIHIARTKGWQNASIVPIVGTVDATLGAVLGAVAGIPPGLVGFFVGGGINGIAAGVGAGAFVANKTGVSFAGNILGAIAGITTGAVSGTGYLAAIEILSSAAGIWKGVGLTALTTNCKRVGFQRFRGGEGRDKAPKGEQPFTNVPWRSKYGLKRLRQWMKDNEDWQQSMVREEIFPGDAASIEHCERVREHSFDMRHAAECMKHSQLCGPSGGLILPVPGVGMCQAISDINYLEEKAVAFGDDPDDGFFAQWRKMQEEIRDQTGYDGKKAQCVKTLCAYGGFRHASLKLHPDRVMQKDIPDEEKVLLTNTFTFLSSCKSEYKGMDGEELTLHAKEERDTVCTALDETLKASLP